jgi:hypothetical protein
MRLYRLLAPCTLLLACNDPVPPTSRATIVTSSRDGRGVPRMLHARGLPLAPAATALASARLHAERLAPWWGVTPDAMPVLEDVASVRIRDGAVARLRQVIDGLPVYREELRMLVRDARPCRPGPCRPGSRTTGLVPRRGRPRTGVGRRGVHEPAAGDDGRPAPDDHRG